MEGLAMSAKDATSTLNRAVRTSHMATANQQQSVVLSARVCPLSSLQHVAP
jgi:hypothetical protein